MKTNNDQNSSLEYLILKALEEHYSCADEILNKLKKEEIQFEERKFFPVLSGLLLKKMLCYNWLENESGMPEKHYHITRTGFSYINE